MLTAEAWFVEYCGRAVPRAARNVVAVVELDLPRNIERATHYLRHIAPESIQGAGGDNTLAKFVVQGTLDYGISDAEALHLILTEYNETKAHPPWSPDDIARKIESAHGSRELPVGYLGLTANDDFGPVDVSGTDTPAAKRGRLFRRGFHESADRALLAPARALIKKFLDMGALSVFYGNSNTGKTFIALDIAYHIAAALMWNGRKTMQAPVVYVAAEAGEDINSRIEALRRHHKPAGAVPLDVVPCLVDLFDAKADVDPLIALIKDAAAEHGAPVGMVVIDTLARAMGSGDENSTRDMGVFVRHMDRIRVATGAHVMVVHHTGKDTARGARGSSALRAATDTEIEITGRTILVKKQRSHRGGDKLGFGLTPVDIGVDEDGDRITSCVVALKTASEFEQLELTEQESEWLDLLQAKVADAAERAGTDPKTTVVNKAEAFNDIKSHYGIELSRQNFDRVMTALKEKGYVKKVKRGQWLIVDDINDRFEIKDP